MLALRPGLQGEVQPVAPGWQLHAVAGYQVGTVWELPVGAHELGRTADLRLLDERVSRRHALLEVDAGGVVLSDLGSRNGTRLDGDPVGAIAVPVRAGAVLEVGDTLLTVAAARQADAAVQPRSGGVAAYTGSPRIRAGRPAVQVVLPTPPAPAARRRVPAVAIVLQLLLGGVLALVTRQPTYLLLTVMSPVMVAAGVVADRREGTRTGRQTAAGHKRARALAEGQVAAGLAAETASRRERAPDGAEAVLAATLPTRRLWERRRTDPDSLVLRVGTCDLSSELTVIEQVSGEPPGRRTVPAVPVTLDLRALGVVGLAGEAGDVRALARWLVVQLAVFHAPRDVAITVLAPGQGGDWSWVRWLPHARCDDGVGPAAQVGTDDETVAARVAELGRLLAARQAADANRADRGDFPAHVLELDGARALAVPGVAALLQAGPEVGTVALCLETEERLLPEECAATVTVDPGRRGHVAVHEAGEPPREAVIAEGKPLPEAERVARALASVRDSSPRDEKPALPGSARLLDLLGLEPPTPDDVRRCWQAGGRTAAAVVGARVDGPFALDLPRDGPHGLIAGTTGSGKSELLQTVIASLAATHRPDQLTFVLVD